MNNNILSCSGTTINKSSDLFANSLPKRVWEKDYTLWSSSPDEITNRLGWLNSIETTNKALPEINAFVEEVKAAGYTSALLLGMGGSSLAPEVLRLMFGVKPGFLDLRVLDSTDPGAVKNALEASDPKTTLYIVSTKSGGTIETLSFAKFFFTEAVNCLGREEAPKHFMAITDPGSGLQTMMEQLAIRKIFINDPNIGGRFSALSLFGMVPAALLGIDVSTFLQRAKIAADASQLNDSGNWPTVLGWVIAQAAKEGFDKLTFLFSKEFSFFGVWVEQLVAESVGKIGKGILPVEGETDLENSDYANDRLFVAMAFANDTVVEDSVNSLKAAGKPVIQIKLTDVYDLGREFFAWEFATAVAGAVMKVHPFDQPNVEQAKIVARAIIAEYKEKGALKELPLSCEENGIKVVGAGEISSIKESLAHLTAAFVESTPRSYFSLQAYVTPNAEITAALQEFRTKLAKKHKAAVTVGFGPRFLHSTGQLHKGDAGSGLFIQFLSKHTNDFPIPEEAGETDSSFSFGVLRNAQALGDRKALEDNNRKVLTIQLGDNPIESLHYLTSLI